MRLAEFLDGTSDDLRLDAGKVRAFFVHVIVIADKFQKKGQINVETFCADALDPCMLPGVDLAAAERRIIQKNLDSVRARLFEARRRKSPEQTRKAPAHRLVI